MPAFLRRDCLPESFFPGFPWSGATHERYRPGEAEGISRPVPDFSIRVWPPHWGRGSLHNFFGKPPRLAGFFPGRACVRPDFLAPVPVQQGLLLPPRGVQRVLRRVEQGEPRMEREKQQAPPALVLRPA
jgi:hypothetical protein